MGVKAGELSLVTEPEHLPPPQVVFDFYGTIRRRSTLEYFGLMGVRVICIVVRDPVLLSSRVSLNDR